MWSVLAALELLFIDLFTIDQTLKTRDKLKPRIIAHIVTAVMTILVVLGMIFLFPRFQNYGVGAGWILFLGIPFIIPISILYQDKFTIKCIAGVFGYTYGICIFNLTIRICYVLGPHGSEFIFFVIQTVLFAATYYFVKKIINKWLFFATMKISAIFEKKLFFFSVSIFFFLIFTNLTLYYNDNQILKLFYVALLVFVVSISYMMSFEYYYEQEKTQKLSELINIDQFTNLKSRFAFQSDLENILHKYQDILIVYIDLDSFKDINDKYGHLVGDDYIINFSGALKKVCLENCELYHISGDEFIAIYYGTDFDGFKEILENLVVNKTNGVIEFLGFSYGCSEYHGGNVENAIKEADRQMYLNKHEKQSKKNQN